MLHSVRFHGFKSLRDVELAGLQQLNVIVGPSGVGKTSVLQGLQFLAQLVADSLETKHLRRRVRRAFSGRSAAERLMTSGETRLTIGCVTTTGQALELVATSEPGQSGRRTRFEIAFGESGQKPQTIEIRDLDTLADLWARLFGREPNLDRSWEAYFGQLGSTVFLKLEADRLGAISLSSGQPHIEHDGGGLATVLAYFAGAYRDRLQSLESELREVFGTTGQIRTFPDEVETEETELIRIDEQLVPRTVKRKHAAYRFEVEIDGLGWVPGDLLSEGILTTLGLLTILHQPDSPRLLLLDDVDQGLHPDAQAKLVTALRKLLARRADMQIVCTSHSPYLLDHFRAEEVQVMSQAGGQVSAARLDNHEDWPRWEGKLQTGEFWQSVGENWVGGQEREREAANE